MMATAKELTLMQDLDIEKRSCASRQFANAQRQNIRGQDEEAALVLAAKSGDGHAFEILFGRHQRKILSVARPFTRIRENAEDAVQQSLQKPFASFKHFTSNHSFPPILTPISTTTP